MMAENDEFDCFLPELDEVSQRSKRIRQEDEQMGGETKRIRQEKEHIQQEMERREQEMGQQMERSEQEMEQEVQELKQKIQRLQQETERIWQETERIRREREQEVDAVSKTGIRRFLQLWHESIHMKAAVNRDKPANSKVSFIAPSGQLVPPRLEPWPEFPALQMSILDKVFDNVPEHDKGFSSRHCIEWREEPIVRLVRSCPWEFE
jgi:septal ring factor EnvC (AmiA/AmiB activator)